jgi:hypothetical protein
VVLSHVVQGHGPASGEKHTESLSVPDTTISPLM